MKRILCASSLGLFLGACASGGSEPDSTASGTATPSAPRSPAPAVPPPPPSASATELVEKGLGLAEQDPEAALQAFRQAESVDPSYALASYDAGVVLERLGRYGEAAKAYDAAIAKDPGLIQAIQNRANLEVRRNESDAAVRRLRTALESRPKDSALRNELISALIRSGQIKEAEAEAKALLKDDEKNVGALMNLAIIFRGRDQLELANSVLDRAREIDETEPMVWLQLGMIYLDRDQRSEAIEAFERAAEYRGDLPEVHNNLGALYVETNDYDAAIASLQRALSLYPDFPEAYLNLGNAYKGALDLKKAEEAYKEAQRLKSSGPEVAYNLGLLYLDNEMPDVDRLERWRVAKQYLQTYLSDASGLDDEESKRVQSYITEAERGLEREKKLMEREERRRLRAAKRAAEEAEREAAEEPGGAPPETPDAPGETPPPGEAPPAQDEEPE